MWGLSMRVTPRVWPALVVLAALPVLTAANGTAVSTILAIALAAILVIILLAVFLTMKRRKGLYMERRHRRK